MNPDRALARKLRSLVESEGDELADLHLWRLGPGHLGAILAIVTKQSRGPEFYHAKLARFGSLSHVTVEVDRVAA
jgi:Co/Zn/Cd efflux system component